MDLNSNTVSDTELVQVSGENSIVTRLFSEIQKRPFGLC